MPKEVTFSLLDGCTAEIQWSKDHENVQLLVRHAPNPFIFESAVWPLLQAVAGYPDGKSMSPDAAEHELEQERYDRLALSLDRAGINKLIRDLRRARDQGFGRDE